MKGTTDGTKVFHTHPVPRRAAERDRQGDPHRPCRQADQEPDRGPDARPGRAVAAVVVMSNEPVRPTITCGHCGNEVTLVIVTPGIPTACLDCLDPEANRNLTNALLEVRAGHLVRRAMGVR
jgi:hypothetical protein